MDDDRKLCFSFHVDAKIAAMYQGGVDNFIEREIHAHAVAAELETDATPDAPEWARLLTWKDIFAIAKQHHRREDVLLGDEEDIEAVLVTVEITEQMVRDYRKACDDAALNAALNATSEPPA